MNILNALAKSSIHILMIEPTTKEPLAFGSGCLVQYKERNFLLSVAHVTDINGLATCIETNQPQMEGKTPLYSVGAMCFFDQYKTDIPVQIFSVKDLFNNLQETLEVTFCEIKEDIQLLQPEWDFKAFKIDTGEKIILNLEVAGEPDPDKLFGFCGRVRQKLRGSRLNLQPTMKLDLKYGGKKGRFYYFLAPEIIKDKEDYQGCSGAPILDEDGRLVALASKVMTNTKLIYGFSITECRNLLDIALQTGML